jgi:cyanophycinase
MGYILLAGGAEFGGQMELADRRAIDLAGGPGAPIRIVPAAAAPDNNHRRAGDKGVKWFNCLGATNVASLPLIDRTSADDPAVVEALMQARLIYLLGGFPRHLAHSLRDSRSWQAIVSAYQAGAVIAGSSAGAMALCDHFYDPNSSQVMQGLELIKDLCILPHHDTFGQEWAATLVKLLPNSSLLGIDEETGVICRVADGLGIVCGKGKLTLYNHGKIENIGPQAEFNLSVLNIDDLPQPY